MADKKAKHPHDASRPEPQKVLRAIENDDIDALRLALTPRQRRFAEEYTVDFNGQAAAIRSGYSTNYADRQAFLLLRHKGVAYLIDHLLRSKEAKITAINPDYIIQKITEIISKEGARDSDKLRGLEMLAKHLGMFIDRTEITGKDGGAIELEQRTKEEAEGFLANLKLLQERSDKKDVKLI